MTETYWLIYIGKKEIRLTEEQFAYMQKQAESNKTIIWFPTFVISIPHVSFMEKINEHKDELPQLPEQSPMERDKARLKIAEIRQNLKKKLATPSPLDEDKRRKELIEQAKQI